MPDERLRHVTLTIKLAIVRGADFFTMINDDGDH